MSWDDFQANCRQLRVRVRAQWHALTDDLERFEGEWDQVLDSLRARDADSGDEEADGKDLPRH